MKWWFVCGVLVYLFDFAPPTLTVLRESVKRTDTQVEIHYSYSDMIKPPLQRVVKRNKKSDKRGQQFCFVV